MTGDISLTLNPKPTVYRLGLITEGVITILDDDAPELQISEGDPVTEGDNVTANFVISTIASPNRSVTIQYDLAESHDFIANEGTGKSADLDFSNGATEATLSIPITNDSNTETNGTITVTLIADTANPATYYVASSPDHTAEVRVIDDDSLPVVEITATNGAVAESTGTANFELTATGLSATTILSINATPAEDGSDFLTDQVAGTPADFMVEFSDSDGDDNYTGQLPITLDNDDVGEATGNIKVTLNTDPDAEKTYTLGSIIEGTITIWDDDTPELKVTAGNAVTETDNVSASFTISAEVSPNDMVSVRYNLAESQDFIAIEGTEKSETLDFSNGATEATLAIPIINDDTAEDNGTITVTLIADNASPIKYQVAPAPNNSAQLNVYDDDSPPTIMITADSGNVVEGDGTARFMLSATGLLTTTEIEVYATPAEVDGNYLTNSVKDTRDKAEIEFSDPDGDQTYSGEFPVVLHKDTAGEPTADIQLTLNAHPTDSDTYRLGSTTTGVITVYDDDAPELSISAVTPTITEGANVTADFLVSAVVSPNKMITVRYDLAESQDFIDNEGTDKTEILDFSGGSKEETLSITTANDTTNEIDGTITVTLTADTADPITYTVAPSPNNTAQVNVIDNYVPPIVWIEADNGNILEGTGEAWFQIFATGITSQTFIIAINATPSELGGNFLASTVENMPVNFRVILTDHNNDDIYTGIWPVNIVDDGTSEVSSDIKLTLNPDLDPRVTYQLGATTEGVFTVFDDDAPQLSLTTTSPTTIYEAEDAEIVFTVSKVLSEITYPNPITVYYSVTESTESNAGDFISAANSGNKSVELDLTTEGKTDTFKVSIESDDMVENSSSVFVKLLPDTDGTEDYTPDPNLPSNGIQINLRDDDSLPVLTIADVTTITTESAGSVDFTISTTTNPGTSLTIRYDPAEVNSADFLDSDPMNDQEAIIPNWLISQQMMRVLLIPELSLYPFIMTMLVKTLVKYKSHY